MFLRIFFGAICLAFICFPSGKGYAQKKTAADSLIIITDTTDLDALFKRARNLAYNKEYESSRKILNAILDSKADYYDVRSFLGRTYAWEGQYNEARTEFSKVLIEKPDFADALDALIDVEIWTEQFIVANEYIKIALGYYPTSEQFLMKKVKVSLRQQDKLTASLTLRKILEINPGNKEALKMLNETGGLKLNNHFTFGYIADFYDKQNKPQQLSSVEYGKSFRFGSLNLRANYADKFGKGGWQGELDAYVNFVKGTYAYLNGGYSQVSIFPDYKFGGDIYQKLFSGFEMSVGARFLHFNTNDSLRIDLGNDTIAGGKSVIYVRKNQGTLLYTVYLGKYFRNYWFSLKTYYTPQLTLKNETGNSVTKKSSATIVLNIRYYLGDADDYFGIKLSSGRSPDEPSAATLDPTSLTTTAVGTKTLNSYSGGVELQRPAFGRWLVKGEFGYTHEDTRADFSLQRLTVNISLKNIF
jgi:tetratricopeptide (TPR) repeat protein